MDSESMDHYEKQLYTVFKTFDVDNEEALDRKAVIDLCDALQLEDRGKALVDTLFERPTERVTFTQFRNGLLSVLGAEPTPPPPAAPSDEESSGREVEPKFVFGSKKYGRRSRPTSAASSEPDSESKRMKCKRNHSIMEASAPSKSEDLDHNRKINLEQALSLCHTLNMDGIDHQLIRQIFCDGTASDMTVGEFFDQLNKSLTMSIACDTNVQTTVPNHDEEAQDSDSTITTDIVVDAWERSGIEHSRRLLHELGFKTPKFRVSQLSRTLDEEIRAFTVNTAPEPRCMLLQASLVLQRLRHSRARRRAEAARAENAKLRTDLADANRRAQTLAQEVDENHARIEASLKGRIKQLEAKHAEELRALTAEFASERDRAAQNIVSLEATLSKVNTEESRLRTEVASLHNSNDDLARRASLAEERTAELEKVKETLLLQLKKLTETPKEVIREDRVSEFVAKIEELQLENKLLRDRNDELCAELETTLKSEVGGLAGVGDIASWREEAGDLCGSRRASSLHVAEDCDQSILSIEHKAIGQVEMARRLISILDTIPQVHLNETNGCESCNTLKGIIKTIQGKVQEVSESVLADQLGLKAADAACQADDGEVLRLRDEVTELRSKYDGETQRLNGLIKALESSLDQLKIEYDKCEDYWSLKMDEERTAFAEEQKISDDRLSELISKISEYEQQFSPKNSTLPTIDESYSLELQFNDLEEEFQAYRKEKERELTEKRKEIEELLDKVSKLEQAKVQSGSPIGYLWTQGTIQSPYNKDKRDYQNPAYVDESKCASDGEKDRKVVHPIQRPLGQRSSSAGALREGQDVADAPKMINCAELEGQLRQQSQLQSNHQCACAALEARCRQMAIALRHRQMALENIQQAARAEGVALRARMAAAEGAVARLQARLAAADVLVKDLYLENCQLAHQTTRLL